MWIDSFLISYLMLFIMGIAMAILYGSIGVALLIISASSLIASGQPQLCDNLGSILKFISILSFLLAIFFLYRAYIKARWDEYYKKIQIEPVSPPTDYLIPLVGKLKKWLKIRQST